MSPTLGAFRWIPPGTFTMGSPVTQMDRHTDEVPHSVTLTRGFYLMQHEVTQGEWRAVMGTNPSADGRQSFGGTDKGRCAVTIGDTLPVVCVSFDEVQEFAARAGAWDGATYRLPTEAEWEYAARAGGPGIFAGSEVLPDGYERLGAVAWYAANSRGFLSPVCGKTVNAFGLCDMSGNVWEWVSDRYGDYPVDAVVDPVGPLSGTDRVIRGGCYGSEVGHLRVAYRYVTDPATRNTILGFRLVRSGL